MNARFWITHLGGFVKLTIKPGAKVQFGTFERHDEGYSRSSETIEYDGAVVTRRYEDDGTDCDGRMWRAGMVTCDVTQLKAHVVDSEPTWPQLPLWELEDSNQRDYAAEAAGY